MIDFITLYFPRYQYRLKSTDGFVLKRSRVNITENIPLQESQFEVGDVTLMGESIVFDGTGFKLFETINGLHISFNPSAIRYGGINFKIVTYPDVVAAIRKVKARVKRVADLDFESAIITRLDISKDIHPKYGFTHYIPVFQWLDGNRSSVVTRWNTTYQWSHRYKLVQVYDKKLQLRSVIKESPRLNESQKRLWEKLKKIPHIMRIEARLMKSHLVQENTNMKTIVDLLDPVKFENLKNCYEQIVRKMFLVKAPIRKDSTVADYSHSGLLKSLLDSVGERKAIDEWLIMLGLETSLSIVGGIEGFQSSIKDAGFVKGTVSKQTKKMKERLEMLRIFSDPQQRNSSSPTLTSLYQEIVNLVIA